MPKGLGPTENDVDDMLKATPGLFLKYLRVIKCSAGFITFTANG